MNCFSPLNLASFGISANLFVTLAEGEKRVAGVFTQKRRVEVQKFENFAAANFREIAQVWYLWYFRNLSFYQKTLLTGIIKMATATKKADTAKASAKTKKTTGKKTETAGTNLAEKSAKVTAAAKNERRQKTTTRKFSLSPKARSATADCSTTTRRRKPRNRSNRKSRKKRRGKALRRSPQARINITAWTRKRSSDCIARCTPRGASTIRKFN
jgi:hypothetical protein